jgi:adenylate cyclase
MDEFLERLYRRMGPRYWWAFVILVSVAALIFTVLAVLALLGFESAAREEFARILLFGAVGSVVAITVIVGMGFNRTFGPLLAWIRGDRDPAMAVDAWRGATTKVLPFVAFGILVFSVTLAPAWLYYGLALDLPRSALIPIFLAIEIMIAGAALVDYFGAEQLLRPVLREIADKLPADFELPEAGLRMRWKLFAAVTLISLATGTFVAAAQTSSLAPASRLIFGIGSAIVLTLTISLLLTTFLTRAVVSPVEELLAASRRVKEGDLSARVPVMSADELGVLSQSFNEMVHGLKERAALSAAMGSYVDPSVAQRVLEEGELLQGEEVEVTLLFLDIRESTARFDGLTAPETVAFLNEFFELVVPIVTRHGGHANKFLGDGVLAVFGTPEPHPDHADRAVAAAREIARRVGQAHDGGVRIGIGLNSGTVVVGTLGGGGHLEFGLIGDAVNVAARVEQLTKETGDTILMTESTRSLLSENTYESRGAAKIRGKASEVLVYAVPAS